MIDEFRFQQNVLPLQGVIITHPAPYNGYIRQVKIHWPPGPNGLVDVRVGHGTQQFLPHEGFLALDNVTPTYHFDKSVMLVHNDNIWVEIRNGDIGNPHNITVTVNVESE